MEVSALLRRHRDLVVAIAVGVAYVVELLLYDRTDRAVALPMAVVAAMMLALRRRAPLTTFLVVSAANFGVLHWAPGYGDNSLSFVVIFLFNLYSLGANARGLEAVLGVVLGLLGTIVAFVVGDGGALGPAEVLFACAFVGTPWAAGLAVRLRGDGERELRARNVALQEESRLAITHERARIARELHDVVSHAIAVTVLQARGGRKLVGKDDASVERALLAIEQTNTAALADMRRLLALLRDADDVPAGNDPLPSLERLDQLVEQVRTSGLPVVLEVHGAPLPVPPGLDLSAYRIVQEALTNVLKHGGAGATALVELTYGPDELEVTVTNTGAPPSAQNGGQGLIGIRERVVVAGGSVETGPTECGYAVRARLPYLVGA